MKDDDGDWYKGDADIADASCSHFQKIFIMEEKHINEEVINCIPVMVTLQQNENL